MPLHLQRVLVDQLRVPQRRGPAACVRSSTASRRPSQEGEVIQTFFNRVERHGPQLVSWNGGGFDLPVLHYRGLRHGVVAGKYWDMGRTTTASTARTTTSAATTCATST